MESKEDLTRQEKMYKHYMELGIMQGKRMFNSVSFVEGVSIGFLIAVILFELTK